MPSFSPDQENSPYAFLELDDPLVFENIQDFSGGMDAFKRATLLASNQSQFLTNVFIRDNYESRTRPGADSILGAGIGITTSVSTTGAFGSGVTSIGVGSPIGIAVGQSVSGIGIFAGTVVSTIKGFLVGNSVTTTATFTGIVSSITVASATGIAIGQSVTGTNIAPGTLVTTVSGTTIGISNPTTGNDAGNYVFATQIVLSHATTAINSGNYTFSGSGITSINNIKYFDTPTYEQLLVGAAAGSVSKFLAYAGGLFTDLSAQYAPTAADTRIAMAQGINQVLICDGVLPYIYDGQNFTATQTGTAGLDCPPNATILVWHTARMFAAGVATTPDGIWVSNLLDFSDGQWNATTRMFRVGVGDGDPIIAMASMQTTVLCVLKRNSVWLVDTNPSNDPAVNTDYTTISGFTAAAIPSTIGIGVGCVGRDAWASYGNDILFMAQDGVRSVQRMQAAAGQWQLTAPLSQPIQPYIQRINQGAWQNIVAKSYLEFILFYVPLDNSLTNNYVLVYNGRLQTWMGAWTMWNGTCVEVTRFNGSPRLVFGDTKGLINQWKDTQDNQSDNTYLDNLVAYPTQIWPKSWQFNDTICNKTGYNLIPRFTAGNASVQFSWVCDLTVATSFVGTFQPTGDILGVGTLPFLLQSDAPSLISEGIRGLPEFNEAFLKIETTNGWIWVRSVAASAFINPLRESYP